jgi:hypothetical protein
LNHPVCVEQLVQHPNHLSLCPSLQGEVKYLATGMSEVGETGPFNIHDCRHIPPKMELLRRIVEVVNFLYFCNKNEKLLG